MKPTFARSAFLPASALAFSVVFGLSGCNTTSRGLTSASAAGVTAPTGMKTCALAVAVRGGFEPTPAQWNALYDKFSKELAARGLFLITDHSKADKIINIEFLPDPVNPSSGTAVISSIVPNTGFGGGTAASLPSFTSYTHSAMNPAWSAMGAYSGYPYDSYYRDYDYYNTGGVTTPPSTTKPPVTTPPKHHPVDPKDCPPDSPYRPPPSFVGTQPFHHRYTPPSSTGPSYRTEGSTYAGSYTSREVPSAGSGSAAATTSAPRSWWREVFGSSGRDSSSRSYSSNDSSRWSSRSSDSSSDWSRSSSYSSSSSDYSSSSSYSSSYAGPSTSYTAPAATTMSFASSASSASDSGSRSTGTQSQSN